MADTTIPDKAILKQMADASYQNNYGDTIDGFDLINQTDTLKFFKATYANLIVVAVRGTADFQDFQAWIPSAINNIQNTERYNIDTTELLNFQQQYPRPAFTYYATGHSLAGAIIDNWLKAGYITEARTYNPAISYSDILDPTINNYRVYSDGDPLYNIMGRFAKGRKEVRNYVVPNVRWWNVKDRILKQHTLQNPIFKGGKIYLQSLARRPVF
ncbi:hypothetical protein [Essdubovirus chlorellae]|nr:hypothetical protein [Chlorella virophage]